MAAASRTAAPHAVAGSGLRIGTRGALVVIVCSSALLRAAAAIAHAAPVYFPDEYIYASISRSIGEHGRPLIRGGAAHFPALLEPLLAAPLWAIASLQTAYRLVQFENAVFISLAAIPVYLLAKRIRLSSGIALVAAVFAVAIPDGTFAGYIIADPLGYLLALVAIYVGVGALQRPRPRAEVAFLAVSTLATLARVQYVVLVPAFVLAAVWLERRSVLRSFRVTLGVLAASVAAVAAVGASRLLGYYSSLTGTHIGMGFVRWYGLELFFLALAGGVVLAPGALVGLLPSRDRDERAFAALIVPFALAVLAEGALYASNNEIPHFKERYLMVLLPMFPLAFGLYLRRGLPARIPVMLLAAAIVAVAAIMPTSSYAVGQSAGDSPFLWFVVALEWSVGVANASLLVALAATVAAAVAAAVACGRLGRAPFAIALALVAALSIGATRFDLRNARFVRDSFVAPDPAWVDATGLREVSVVQTSLAPDTPTLEALFFNSSIKHEFLFGDGKPTDAFAAPRLTVSPTGVLAVHGRPLTTPILFQGYATTAMFEGVRKVGQWGSSTLWKPAGTPRLRMLETGRFGDGWLALRGQLEVWAARAGTVRFVLTLPRSHAGPVGLRFAGHRYRVMPGRYVAVSLTLDGTRPLLAQFQLLSGGSVVDRRFVSVRSTVPVFAPR